LACRAACVVAVLQAYLPLACGCASNLVFLLSLAVCSATETLHASDKLHRRSCAVVPITSPCLASYCSSTETLDADDKFHCDKCGCLQEAQVRRLAALEHVRVASLQERWRHTRVPAPGAVTAWFLRMVVSHASCDPTSTCRSACGWRSCHRCCACTSSASSTSRAWAGGCNCWGDPAPSGLAWRCMALRPVASCLWPAVSGAATRRVSYQPDSPPGAGGHTAGPQRSWQDSHTAGCRLQSRRTCVDCTPAAAAAAAAVFAFKDRPNGRASGCCRCHAPTTMVQTEVPCVSTGFLCQLQWCRRPLLHWQHPPIEFAYSLSTCADSSYELFAVVVHMGAHPNHGKPAGLALTAA